MPKYVWKVTGTNKRRKKLEPLTDKVETSKLDSGLALRKARTKWPKAPELAVTRIVGGKDGET